MFIRNKNRIMNTLTNEAEAFGSINKAKRRSKELQLSNGGLGLGYVKVGRFPKKKRD